MAPKKRKSAAVGGEEVKEAVTATVAEAKKESTVIGRVTRSSSMLASKEAVTEPKKKTGAVEEKVVKKSKIAKKEEVKEVKKEVAEGKNVKKVKTIVIEHCKQCNAFKTRAMLVKEGLEKAIDGIQVLVNPEKPRRGCFEIRAQDGETFLTLLDMKRPFPPLKALDMEKVISDIIKKVK